MELVIPLRPKSTAYTVRRWSQVLSIEPTEEVGLKRGYGRSYVCVGSGEHEGRSNIHPVCSLAHTITISVSYVRTRPWFNITTVP